MEQDKTGATRVNRSDTWRRDFITANHGRCHYCNRSGYADLGPDERPWHIDHKKPLARGGSDTDDNLVLACKRCNLAKGVQPYDQFKRFAAAAFWTPADWRVSEFDLDALMDGYQEAGSVAEDTNGPWRVDMDTLAVVEVAGYPCESAYLQPIFRYERFATRRSSDDTNEPVDELQIYKHKYRRAHATLLLIADIHRLLPALVAEIRMLRGEQAEREEGAVADVLTAHS